MTSKVNQGHIRPLLWQIHSSTFIYEPILMEICIKPNIIKAQFFDKLYMT